MEVLRRGVTPLALCYSDRHMGGAWDGGGVGWGGDWLRLDGGSKHGNMVQSLEILDVHGILWRCQRAVREAEVGMILWSGI